MSNLLTVWFSPLETSRPALLVLENCSLEDVEYWLGFLENRFARNRTIR